MRAEGDGEAACPRPQHLPGKSEGPMGGTASDRPRGTWPDRSSTTLRTETEVSVRGELDVVNVEGGGKYLGTGGLHIMDGTTGFLKCGH